MTNEKKRTPIQEPKSKEPKRELPAQEDRSADDGVHFNSTSGKKVQGVSSEATGGRYLAKEKPKK